MRAEQSTWLFKFSYGSLSERMLDGDDQVNGESNVGVVVQGRLDGAGIDSGAQFCTQTRQLRLRRLAACLIWMKRMV